MAREHQHPGDPAEGARPFDREYESAAELTHQFWGSTRGWESTPDAPGESSLWAERTGSLGAIRHGVASLRSRRTDTDRVAVARRSTAGRRGGIDRTRTHGIVRPGTVRPDDHTDQLPVASPRPRSDATLAELASGAGPTPRRSQRAGEVEWDVELELNENPRPRSGVAPLADRLGLGAVDPLLMRLGALVLAGALAVPVAIGLRDTSGEGLATASVVAPAQAQSISSVRHDVAQQPGAIAAAAGAPPAAGEATDEAAPAESGSSELGSTATPPSAGSSAATELHDSGSSSVHVDDASDAAAPVAAAPEAATVSSHAERVEPVCAHLYEAVAGDSWYRIADAAGVTPGELLDANLAEPEAPIFPGDEICLPEGASIPSPPTTSAPSTTSPPASTQAPSTTAGPTTTAAPTTTVAPVSTAEVQRLIREIWPDELEERALEIAWRESGYRANAYNGWCCYGVFQLYWTAHRSWLDEYGITSSSDLFDARKNITAAHALYQRSGGWGPWGG